MLLFRHVLLFQVLLFGGAFQLLLLVELKLKGKGKWVGARSKEDGIIIDTFERQRIWGKERRSKGFLLWIFDFLGLVIKIFLYSNSESKNVLSSSFIHIQMAPFLDDGFLISHTKVSVLERVCIPKQRNFSNHCVFP